SDLVVRGRPEAIGDADLGSATLELPLPDELAQHLAGEADATDAERRVVRLHVPHMAMDVREHDVEIGADPVVLVVARDLKLDRQGAVRSPLVLSYEAVCLQPPCKRRLRGLDDLPVAK